MTNEATPESALPDWYHTFDSSKWAKGFIEILKEKGVYAALDESWIQTWIANAMMKGWDEHSYHQKESDTFSVIREALPWLRLSAPTELIARLEAVLDKKDLPFKRVPPPEM